MPMVIFSTFSVLIFRVSVVTISIRSKQGKELIGFALWSTSSWNGSKVDFPYGPYDTDHTIWAYHTARSLTQKLWLSASANSQKTSWIWFWVGNSESLARSCSNLFCTQRLNYCKSCSLDWIWFNWSNKFCSWYAYSTWCIYFHPHSKACLRSTMPCSVRLVSMDLPLS